MSNEKKSAKKPRNEMVYLGSVLFAITFVVALLLGMTNDFTKDRIAKAKEQATVDAMKLVQPAADAFSPIESQFPDASVQTVNEAKAGDKVVGWCVKVAPRGFSDAIQMMVGIGTDYKVTGVSIISILDTPGLGAKATDPNFIGQYASKTGPLKVVKGSASGENEISALTGATVTSKAVTGGVQSALDTIAKLRAEGKIK